MESKRRILLEVSAGLLGWNLMSRRWLTDPGGKENIAAHISAEGCWNVEVSVLT